MTQQIIKQERKTLKFIFIKTIINQTGDVLEETFYEPFGSIISGGELTMFDYEGREFSELTGDYDFRFRKYDPELGIFTQPDAGIQDIYDPQALNRYAFERNNPYRYVDPDGRYYQLALALGGAYIGAVYYDYLVNSGQVEYSWQGQLTYVIAGGVSVLLASQIAIVGGGGLLAHGLGSGVGSGYSTLVTNLGTGQPATQNIVQSTIVGGVIGAPFGRLTQGKDISKALGLLGLQELLNRIALADYSNYGYSNNYYSQVSYSYQINQAQLSSGGGNYGVHCDQYGCYSGQIPDQSSGGGTGESNGGGSGGGGNDGGDNDYCSSHSAWWC